MGQVSNSNAHELIHRSNRRLFHFGKWVYISMLYGHHTSTHLLVHHRFAASERDPCSAPKGGSFYAFAQWVWIGSARAGFKMESERLKNRHMAAPRFNHPYYSYTFGAIASLLIAFLVGGWGGIIALIALASYAQIQLLLSDYVQHYGLRRAMLPNGNGPYDHVSCSSLDVDVPDAGCTAPFRPPRPSSQTLFKLGNSHHRCRAKLALQLAGDGRDGACSASMAARHGPACAYG